MNNNESNSNYIWIILFILVILAIGYWFFTRPQETSKENTTTNKVTQTTDTTTNNNDNTDTTNQNNNTDTDNTTTNPTDDEGDFTTYSESKQTVGDSSNKEEYTLKSITNSSKTGYHNFVFILEAKLKDVTAPAPYVTAEYKSSLGAIRIDLNGVTTDQSGIGYQKSSNIDKEGVIRLYHNVSADSTEELYDIGVSKPTPFKIFATENGEDSWKITVNVKYPGGNTTSEPFGSADFSKDLQAIDGGLVSDNSKISAYSYSTASGVLAITFSVSGSTSRPVPSATAQYNSEGKLELKFPGLVSDSINSSMNNKKIGAITINTSRSGNESTYIFNGASKEYRLSATKSPNQVLFEIKL